MSPPTRCRTRNDPGAEPGPQLVVLRNVDTDDRTRRVPSQRRTQSDFEAILKMKQICRAVEEGLVTTAEAWPWLRLEVGA